MMSATQSMSYEAFIEHSLICLTGDHIDFAEFLEYCHNLKSRKYGSVFTSYFERMLKDTRLLKKLIDMKLLTNSRASRIWNDINTEEALDSLNENTFLQIYFVESKVISFKALVDKYVSSDRIVWLISDEPFFKQALLKNLLTKTDLEYLSDAVRSDYDRHIMLKNASLVECFIAFELLNGSEVYEFLHSISSVAELRTMLTNNTLMRFIFSHLLLDDRHTQKFEQLLADDAYCKHYNIRTVADYLFECNEDYQKFKLEHYATAPNSMFLASTFFTVYEAHA